MGDISAGCHTTPALQLFLDHSLYGKHNQEAIIKMYAERVGEKIGRLVFEVIVDNLTLLWA
jgi:hypothetical protein